MLPLATRIQFEAPSAERRRRPRHALGLPVEGAIRAVIENISESGLALTTDAPLRVGNEFEFELPVAGVVSARVAWAEDAMVGAEFLTSISRAAVSAARLRSPFEPLPVGSEASPAASPAALPIRRYQLAIGVMGAFAVVVAMFLAALLTAPFATF